MKFDINKTPSKTHDIGDSQISRLQADDIKALAIVAVTTEEKKRSGTFVLKDSSTVCSCSFSDGLELLPIDDALRKYNWLSDKYYWGLVSSDKILLDRKLTFTGSPLGYFLRVRKGQKVKLPVQTALYMTGLLDRQELHNIVILEEDSELELITGCVSNSGMKDGEHAAVTETYIGKNARLTNTMVHSWNRSITVMPHSSTLVDAM